MPFDKNILLAGDWNFDSDIMRARDVFLGSLVVGEIHYWPTTNTWGVKWTDSSGGNTINVDSFHAGIEFLEDLADGRV